MDTEIDLRVFLVPIVRRYRLILGAAVLAAISAALFSFLQTPTYRAVATVLVTQPQFQIQFDPRFVSLPEQNRPARALNALAKSPALVQRVLEKGQGTVPLDTIDSLLGKIEILQPDDPSIVQIAVRDADRERASRLANTWAEAYVQYVNDLYMPRTETEGRLEAQLIAADGDLKTAEDALIGFQKENDSAALNQRLAAKLDVLRRLMAVGDGIATGVFSTTVTAGTEELHDLLRARSQLRLAAQDARSLADQIRRQGNSPAARSGLSVLLVELEALSAPAKSPVQLQVPADRAALDGLGPPELVAALEALTKSLAEKEQALSGQIEATTRGLARLDGVEATLAQPASPSKGAGAVTAEARRLTDEILALQQTIAEKTRALDRLTLKRDVARNTYVSLTNKLAEVRLASQTVGGMVRLASPAIVPQQPSGSRTTQNAALGLVAGLLVGLLGAFGLEYLPGALRTGLAGIDGAPETAFSAAVAEGE